MKRYKHKFIACLAGIFLVNITPILKAAPVSQPEPAFSLSQDNTVSYNNEIILLLGENITYEDGEELLASAPGEADIIEHMNDYMLIKTADNNLTDVLNYLKDSPLVAVAEYNSEMKINCFTSFSETPIRPVSNIDMNILKVPSNYFSPGLKGRKVIVAILDTGVDYLHPDLKNHMWINKEEIAGDGIDNDNNGYVDDIYGWDFYNDDASVCHYVTDSKGILAPDPADNDNHGTHCAGIIVAAANNFIGIDLDINIMSLKIHGGNEGKGTIANAVKAIKYASVMGADVCNMSWGTTTYSEALEQVMRESTMLFVTAAGNEGISIDKTPLYPASYALDNLITVTFTNSGGKLTPESNYGRKTVDVAAPGIDITSTIVGSFSTMSGSSMAAPYITGLAAIYYSAGSHLYAANIKEVMLKNIKQLPSLSGYITYPCIPDAEAATKNFEKLISDTTLPTLYIETYYEKETLLLKLSSNDEKGSGVRAVKYATGKKQIKDFKKGMAGTSVRSDTLALSKAGEYTFYISDYAGNETLYYYTVYDDLAAPKISASSSVIPGKSSFTVTAKITDDKSGVKQVKYLEGERTTNDFRSLDSGKIIESGDGENYTFTVNSPGKYTIYAVDYRGNKSCYTIALPELIVKEFSISHSGQIMTAGNIIRLTASFKPEGTTDTVTFKSSKPSVAIINQSGLVTAISPGITIITATTNQGLSANCLIFVSYSIKSID